MNTTTQRVIANVMVEKDMDWAISRQAVRATGGSFNEQDVPTPAVDEIPRVPDTLSGDDVLWTALSGAEAGLKRSCGNKSAIPLGRIAVSSRTLSRYKMAECNGPLAA